MKSIFFHLMPYRDLPADFEQRYESVWVTPPNAELCDPAKVVEYYKWNLDELELADELGFDGLGVNEHHQNAYGFMASPNLMAAALARRTRNKSAILVLGNTLALYSPALRVAEEFAMLDCLSEGRLAAGFPVGTSMDVNRCYGITPTETRPRFNEAHDLIMKAWTQPGPFIFNGRFNKLRYVNPWPLPVQKPHPPVWLAGGGSVETWEMAVKNDYTYSFLSFFGYKFAQKVMGGFWDAVSRLGGDDNPYRAGLAQQVCVSETDAQAEKDYLEHVTYFFNKCLHIPAYIFETPGYRTRRSAEFAIKTDQPGDIARGATLEKNWRTLVDNGFIIAGSPDTVADRLIEACRGLRVGNLIALLQIGSMGHELTKKNLTLFAEGVMPKIKGLWADEGWEHRWWPQGARQEVPVAPAAPLTK
jgi:alkanesulfonate monooxygenase SsuD/methylene tetrahydromethanopterin reductase-like flavin-dependent oxidoreductase (luciferase family)